MITVSTEFGRYKWLHVKGVTIRFIDNKPVLITPQSLGRFISEGMGLVYDVRNWEQDALPLTHFPTQQATPQRIDSTGLTTRHVYVAVQYAIVKLENDF